MKIYAQAYKTYEGARKRMLLERATNKGDYVWGVHHAGFSKFHVMRHTRREAERAQAIGAAIVAFGFDDEVGQGP